MSTTMDLSNLKPWPILVSLPSNNSIHYTRFPHEIVQTTTTRTITPNTRRHHPVWPHTHHYCTLPRPHTQPHPTDTNTSWDTTDDTRTSPQTCRQVLIHHHTPLREGWSGSTPSTIYDKAFSNNSRLSTHTIGSLLALHNILQHCSPRQIPLRPTPEQHHHLHRRLLPDTRQTVPTAPTSWRTRLTDTILRHIQRMGSGRISPQLHHTPCNQWHCSTKATQTLRQQQSLYLFPRSLGSHHHTGAYTTSPHTNIHPTLRQWCSHPCHHQGIWETHSIEQPDRVSLDLAQPTETYTDPPPSSHSRKHCRSLQQRRLLHSQTT